MTGTNSSPETQREPEARYILAVGWPLEAPSIVAAKWLGSLVKNTAAEVEILQVFPPVREYGQPLTHEVWVRPDVPMDAARKNTADPDWQQLQERLGLPVAQVRQVVTVGKPQDEILSAIKDTSARAVIMGQPQRGLTHRLWRIAVAQLQRRSPVPVIVVPPQGDPVSTRFTPGLSRAG